MFLPFQTSSKHCQCTHQYLLRTFSAYSVPEEIITNRGHKFTSTSFQNFLKQWKIHHCCSSVAYPQSNCYAEVAVKTSKRIIRENISPDGTLNNNKVATAILQNHNIPLDGINLNLVQILFHHQLGDSLPTHPTH